MSWEYKGLVDDTMKTCENRQKSVWGVFAASSPPPTALLAAKTEICRWRPTHGGSPPLFANEAYLQTITLWQGCVFSCQLLAGNKLICICEPALLYL